MTGIDGDGEHRMDAAPGSRPGARRLRAGLLLVVVLLAVTAAVLTILERRADERDRLAAQTVVAAETAALAVLDYRPETVAEDLAAAEELLAPPFLDRFRQQSREVTVPRSTAGQVASSARSSGSALATLDGDEALVVVYLDRHTVGADDIPHVLQTVVEVGLVRDDDRWLVAEFTPR
ncbi:hypothetical protein [Dietzia lutea]|uniref:Mce-associated membrane protein n=1 Tax=Dietzia lutea TaxID=546160 RepID=A0A2S1R8Z5_9ACTN|nr:hypothetical protein [Dietzia lutea]AWH92760.1 hypothetical protein A6035_11895 [Dietzia lutea]